MSLYEQLRSRYPVTDESIALEAEVRLVHDVAELLHNARVSKQLTQTELAAIAKTTQSGIARQEDPDYTGAKLSTVARLFAALGYELELSLKPLGETTRVEPRRRRKAR